MAGEKSSFVVKKSVDKKTTLAKTIVLLDDAIGSSGGLADFLGRMIANAFGLMTGAELSKPSEDSDKVESSED